MANLAWDRPGYSRIEDARYEDGKIVIQFADGDVIEIEPGDLKNAPSDLRWEDLAPDTHAVLVPRASVEEPLAVSWLDLRALTDDGLSSHLANAADAQARNVGRQLSALRRRRGLSAKDIAERAGITPQSLSRIENGHHDVVFRTLRRILVAMDYTLADLAREERSTESYERARRITKRAASRAGRSRTGLTKSEFVNRVAERSGLHRPEAERAVDAFLDSITEALGRGEEVTLVGFGKFSVANRGARRGVNPRKPDEVIEIPATRVPRFSPTPRLKKVLQDAS